MKRKVAMRVRIEGDDRCDILVWCECDWRAGYVAVMMSQSPLRFVEVDICRCSRRWRLR